MSSRARKKRSEMSGYSLGVVLSPGGLAAAERSEYSSDAKDNLIEAYQEEWGGTLALRSECVCFLFERAGWSGEWYCFAYRPQFPCPAAAEFVDVHEHPTSLRI